MRARAFAVLTSTVFLVACESTRERELESLRRQLDLALAERLDQAANLDERRRELAFLEGKDAEFNLYAEPSAIVAAIREAMDGHPYSLSALPVEARGPAFRLETQGLSAREVVERVAKARSLAIPILLVFRPAAVQLDFWILDSHSLVEPPRRSQDYSDQVAHATRSPPSGLPWSREAELIADIETSHQRFKQLGGVIGDVAALNATKKRVEERRRLHSVFPLAGLLSGPAFAIADAGSPLLTAELVFAPHPSAQERPIKGTTAAQLLARLPKPGTKSYVGGTVRGTGVLRQGQSAEDIRNLLGSHARIEVNGDAVGFLADI